MTVTGPGGVGKTRLVLETVADLVEQGTTTVFVGLAVVTVGERVPEAIASALSLRIGSDPSVPAVAAALAGHQLVLVLDNCEHVVAACRELVTELQRRAPGVRVLATSRVTLNALDEHVVRLQPLPLPRDSASLDDLARQPGVRAFLAHAQRRQANFALTAENAGALVSVIRRLDGLPLAIELAAGQVAVLPLAALHDRLHRALDLLAADRPTDHARHRTLRDTIGWSYELLTPPEQALLCALAPFPGGADLETVEQLATETVVSTEPLVLLGRLVDASLVVVDQLGVPRYTLLDTVRAFLLDQLDESGRRGAAEQRFLDWARATAKELGSALRSSDEPTADRRLRAELSNLRAARDLARRRGDLDLPVALSLHLDTASLMRDITELWAWSRELAAEPTLPGHPQEVAILGSAAEASWLLGDLVESERLARRGLEVAAETSAPEPLTRRCWSALAVSALFGADFATSRDLWIRAAALSGDGRSTQLATAAMAAAYAGDRSSGAELLARAWKALPPGRTQRPQLSRVRRRRGGHRPAAGGSELSPGDRAGPIRGSHVRRGAGHGRLDDGVDRDRRCRPGGRGVHDAARLLAGPRQSDPALDDRTQRRRALARPGTHRDGRRAVVGGRRIRLRVGCRRLFRRAGEPGVREPG